MANISDSDIEKLMKKIEMLENQVSDLNGELETYKKSENKDLPGRFLTKEEVLTFQPNDPYYNENRWDHYYQEMVDELSKFKNINSILEMGPYKAPLVENSDVIDIQNFSSHFPFKCNNVIVHDCMETPYPIEDKKYDLVIACQVLEHLGYRGEQVDIFKEIARISKKAIISLPYKWHAPLARNHHRIDEDVFDAWTKGFDYEYETTSQWTILRVYDFGE